jgi:1-acyl-sn-glycerol-3-phosphate acyltransferase
LNEAEIEIVSLQGPVMNRYPSQFAPKSWGPNLRPWFVRLVAPIRRFKQSRAVGLARVEVRGTDHLHAGRKSQMRLLIAPNHSSHADPFTIYAACDAAKTTCHIMAAWHVFSQFSPVMQRILQWHGCFSVDREANDIGAFRNAIEVLRARSEPLVIFPEGEIYHLNDRVMPFREGAAAIAIGAARKSERPVAIVPTAIKYRYLDDPTQHILNVLDDIERRILWRSQAHKPIVERLYAIAEAVIGLKELEYLGSSRSGELSSRLRNLGEEILLKLESRHGACRDDSHPVRVKELRRTILTKANDRQTPAADQKRLSHDLEDLFVVTQLYSYPGDYLRTQKPSIERIAETVDKLEEDVLQRQTASIRGRREAIVEFGAPIAVPAGKSRTLVAELTATAQKHVQSLIDGL